jgi:tetratricopeptide (TPR) repeat protein
MANGVRRFVPWAVAVIAGVSIPLTPAGAAQNSGQAQGAADQASPVSTNSEAAAAYARAEALMQHADPRTGGSFKNARDAIALYERSATLDPHLARAYVQIARAWQVQGYSDPDAPSADTIRVNSKEALTHALRIDPSLPDAHALLATSYYLTDYDWKAAEREYRWVIKHDPDNAQAHSGLAQLLGTLGRFDEAIQQARMADRIRHSPGDAMTLARLYYAKRDFPSAVQNARRAVAAQENQAFRFFLGMMLLAKGDRDEAISELERAANQPNNNAGAMLGLAYGYAVEGRRAEAMSLLDKVAATHSEDTIPAYRRAAVYLALGDKAKALQDLDKDYDDRGNWVVQLKVDPVMDPLRSDPGFKSLMRKLRLG